MSPREQCELGARQYWLARRIKNSRISTDITALKTELSAPPRGISGQSPAEFLRQFGIEL